MNAAQTDESYPEIADISAAIEAALTDSDGDRLNDLLDSVTISEALRELLSYAPNDQDRIISLLSADLASRLIEEAPVEVLSDECEPVSARAMKLPFMPHRVDATR